MTISFDVIVDALYRQGDNNLGVTLVSRDGRPLPDWTPGSHISLQLRNNLIRQYSLTGKGDNPFQYEICIAREKTSRGGSAYVHDVLRPGQVVSVSEPKNLFPLVPAKKVILLAAGIGITPLYAMAEELEATGVPFVLHYYLKSRNSAAFTRELSRPLQHGQCDFWYSSDGNSPRTHIPEELLTPAGDSHIYLCGPQGFMTQMTENAIRQGWQKASIHTEAFRPPELPQSVDDSGAFTVTLSSTGEQFTVPADKTIAVVLLENGVDIPLSCEMGMCGACLTPVVSGTVDHRDTVQSEGEKAADQQHIALCCSRSHSGELVVAL
ncbi:PDR/VanB family oxidoreductase [Tatumella sp. UBA2305]|uniref:PDR/VanB family oxidoreductase n=1 Tax=Tatumella sp. UBA2305 TaxID=1947647 RepID=UPI0025DB55F5|nr:PDR/VanB family oxidoreductase [Tatumella sp. UBA2305]